MRKRLRKKLAKKNASRDLSLAEAFESAGSLAADHILLELERPSRITGTAEDWLIFDNKCHPYWTRTTWGGLTHQSILQKFSS